MKQVGNTSSNAAASTFQNSSSNSGGQVERQSLNDDDELPPMFEADDKEISIATIDHSEKLVSHSFMPESKRVGADLKQLGSLLLRDEEEKEETQRSGK